MNRLLRAIVLPLLALAGVALLAWGVVDWWRFHRDLYVEEELALQALADQVQAVRFRRAGDLEELGRSRWEPYGVERNEPLEIPWSVPFVRRVEYVEARDDDTRWDSPPPLSSSHVAARNRVLALPGLRGFRDSQRMSESQPLHDAAQLPLGRPLPKLPRPALTPEMLLEPLPTGTPLEGAARSEAVAAILSVWNAPETDRSRLVYSRETWEQWTGGERETRERVTLIDGSRQLHYDSLHSHWSLLSGGEGDLAIVTEERVQELCTATGRARIVARFDRRLPDAAERIPSSPTLPLAGDPPAHGGSEGGALGLRGERITRIDRIGDARLRLESESDSSSSEVDEAWRFRAILRTDLGYAIERFDFAHYEQMGLDGPRTYLEREVRRLEVMDGEPLLVERLSDRDSGLPGNDDGGRFPAGNSPADATASELVVVEFDPEYAPAALDPASYGVAAWPEPTALPTLRRYRLAWAAGGVCLLLAAVGALLPHRPRRRLPSFSRRPSPPLRLRLRFGLLSMIAITLLVIGAAGWAKRHVDETNDELVLLKDLLNEDSRVTFTREKASFPWAFVSTDSFPVGTPLASVRCQEPLPAELVDRLMVRSPAVRLESPSTLLYYSDRTPESAEPSIGVRFPPFESVATRPLEEFDPIERGNPLDAEERDRIVGEAIAAWRRARGARPERFLLRQRSTRRGAAMRLTVRDGPRFWTLRSPAVVAAIWTADERF